MLKLQKISRSFKTCFLIFEIAESTMIAKILFYALIISGSWFSQYSLAILFSSTNPASKKRFRSSVTVKTSESELPSAEYLGLP